MPTNRVVITIFFVFMLSGGFPATKAASNPLTNYKSGISIGLTGTDGVDYVFERWYYDPLIDDHGLIYIKSNVPISLTHNERNSNQVLEWDQDLSAMGPYGLPLSAATNCEGIIRYKVDRDLGYKDQWALKFGITNYVFNLLPEFTNAFAFDDLNYGPDYPSIPVVGTTGPVPGTTNGISVACYKDHWYRGLLDAYSNEWHTITVGDDDTELLGLVVSDKETSLRTCGSDGKIHYFVVNPVTPALWCSAATTNAEWYTTPPKAYFIPKLYEQTTYLTDGIRINLANIMSTASVYYRIDGGNYQLYSSPINMDSLSDGEHLLECYYVPDHVLKRRLVKNPGFPSDNDRFADGTGHGYLLWRDEDALRHIRNRLLVGTTTNAVVEKLRSEYAEMRADDSRYGNATNWFASEQNLGERLSFEKGVGPASCAFIATMEGLDRSLDWARYAKEMVLENEFSIDPVGYELNMNNSVMPSFQERVGLGYYNGKPFAAIATAYDLLIEDFRAPAYADGFTPIEDYKARDLIAANILQSFHDRQGLLFHPGMGITPISRNVYSLLAAMAMPSYSTPYYGTCGFDGNTNAAAWLPFPDQAVTWKEVLYDDNVTPTPYPNQTFGMNMLAQPMVCDFTYLYRGTDYGKTAGTMDGTIQTNGICNYPSSSIAYLGFNIVGAPIAMYANLMRLHPDHDLDMDYMDAFFDACINSNQPIDTTHIDNEYSQLGYYPNVLICNERFPDVAGQAIDQIFYDGGEWMYAVMRPYVLSLVNPDWEADDLPPSARFFAETAYGAVPLTATFIDTSVGVITNRYWDFGDGTTTNTSETAVTHIYRSSGSMTVSLTVSGPEGSTTRTSIGCVDVSSGTVVAGYWGFNSPGWDAVARQNWAPVLTDVNADDSSVCIGLNVRSAVNSPETVLTMDYAQGNGDIQLYYLGENVNLPTNAVGWNSLEIRIRQIGTNMVSPMNFSTSGTRLDCGASPLLTALPSSSGTYGGINVTVTDQSGEWRIYNFDLSGRTNAFKNSTRFDPFTALAAGENSGKFEIDYIKLIANVPPQAEFTATPTSGSAPLTVTFTDCSAGTFTNRYWSFGDGTATNTTDAVVTHVYSSVGTNTVQLIVNGPVGSSTNIKSGYIQVATAPIAPTAAFTATPTSGLGPLTVTFADSSTGSITSRVWSFGDGITTNTTATNVTHVYTAPGTNTVLLTVSGPGGSDICSNSITVNDSSSSSTSVVTVADWHFNDVGTAVTNRHNWSPKSSDPTATSYYPSYNVAVTSAVSGSEKVLMMGYAAAADVKIYYAGPAVDLPPEALSWDKLEIRLRQIGTNMVTPVTFTNFGTYLNCGIMSAFNPLPSASGTYNGVNVTVTDQSGEWRVYSFDLTGLTNSFISGARFDPFTVPSTGTNSGTYEIDYITLSALVPGEPAPVSGFSATPSSGSSPLTVTFADSSTGIITNRFWDFGDGTTINTTGTNVTHVYTSAGTNTVQLMVSGPGGLDTDTQVGCIVVTPGIITVGDWEFNDTGTSAACRGNWSPKSSDPEATSYYPSYNVAVTSAVSGSEKVLTMGYAAAADVKIYYAGPAVDLPAEAVSWDKLEIRLRQIGTNMVTPVAFTNSGTYLNCGIMSAFNPLPSASGTYNGANVTVTDQSGEWRVYSFDLTGLTNSFISGARFDPFTVPSTGTNSGTYEIDYIRLTADCSEPLSGELSMIDPIQEWRLVCFGTAENEGAASDTANPAGDGLPNLIKYALGLDPASNYMGSTYIPHGRWMPPYGYVYTFTRNPNSEDVTLVIEATDDLSSGVWMEINPLDPVNQVQVRQNVPEDGMETITVKDVSTNSVRRFLRLKVTRP